VSVVVVCSAHGAPGVTTTTLALASTWPAALPGRRVLLIDADAAGSGLVGGLLRSGVPATCGVLALAAGRPPLSAEEVVDCSIAIDANSTVMVVPGVTDPVQARPLGPTWDALAVAAVELGRHGVDLVVDVGRLGHRFEPTPLMTEADVVAVVMRADVASAVPTAAAVRSLGRTRANRAAPIALVVGGGYSRSEIEEAVGVVAHQLPLDARSARTLNEGAFGSRLDRSPLLRAARVVVERISSVAPDPSLAVSG
jgi:MinD-like ATPase involved in chromosome partitioning or flagellar assembly